MIEEGIAFGNGEGMHVTGIEGPEIEHAPYLMHPHVEGSGGRGREWQ